MRRTTASPAISLTLLAVGLLVMVFYLLWTFSWVNHTNVVIQRALLVEKLLLDLQTATRGYYLTSDPSFLQPYRDSLPELPAAIQAFKDEVRDNPLQHTLAEKVDADAQQWLVWAGAMLRTAENNGEKPSVAELQASKERFDNVRDDVTQFLNNEYQLRDERAQQTTRITWTVLAIAALATTLVAIIQCRGVKRRLGDITLTYREALRLAKERRLRAQGLLEELDRELKAVGEIQRSLLPIQLPNIPGLDLAASYQTSRRAGGDYYDFFRLPPEHPDDHRLRYGILIADVSGHGTPAAVLMAVTHSIAHGFEQPTSPPNELLAFVNKRLCDSYTTDTGVFVTAFYAIYDPTTRQLTYSSAGHNPPRLRRHRDEHFVPMDEAQGFPLGVVPDEPYPLACLTLAPGDTIVMYTDGITEARPTGSSTMLEVEGLDGAMAQATTDPAELLNAVLEAVKLIAGDEVNDDRTVLILRANGLTDVSDAEQQHTVIVDTPVVAGTPTKV